MCTSTRWFGGETADSRTFDKDRSVKRLTDAGITLPIATVFADWLVQTDTYLRGERADLPSAGAEGKSP